MRRKIGLFNLRNVVYKEEETKTEHAIGLYPRKTIYLDILTMHTQLHAKYLTPHLVYILFFSLENDVMETSKRCVKLFSLIFILK